MATDPLGLVVFGPRDPRTLKRAATHVLTVWWEFQRNNIRSAGTIGLGLADLGTLGAISGTRRSIQAYGVTQGSTVQKLAAAGEAFQQGQAAVVTLGFTDAEDKLLWASEFVGVEGMKRGGALIGEGIGEGNLEKVALGLGEAVGGIGQLSGLAAATAMPLAKAGYLPQPRFIAGQARGAQVVAEGPETWTMPSGRIVTDQAEYIWRMRHRHRSMLRARAGRQAHRADEIRSAGFDPSDVRLSEGPRNFVPEAVEDLFGSPHLLEIKTSGYYSASYSNNVYPAAIHAGRHGVPFTLRIHSGVRLSRPLERLIRKVQSRFGGEIVRVP